MREEITDVTQNRTGTVDLPASSQALRNCRCSRIFSEISEDCLPTWPRGAPLCHRWEPWGWGVWGNLHDSRDLSCHCLSGDRGSPWGMSALRGRAGHQRRIGATNSCLWDSHLVNLYTQWLYNILTWGLTQKCSTWSHSPLLSPPTSSATYISTFHSFLFNLYLFRVVSVPKSSWGRSPVTGLVIFCKVTSWCLNFIKWQKVVILASLTLVLLLKSEMPLPKWQIPS